MTRKEGKTITHSNAGVLSPTHASYQAITRQVQALLLPPKAACHPRCLSSLRAHLATAGWQPSCTAFKGDESVSEGFKNKTKCPRLPNPSKQRRYKNHRYLLRPWSATDVTRWKSNYQWVTYWITGLCSAPEKFKQRNDRRWTERRWTNCLVR